MNELENALAWFGAAPSKFYRSGKDKLEGVAQWIWEVIQGDFAEGQTTAQMITGTVISMIPLVDQICDVRDVVANSKKINKDTTDTWAWVALVLTLIGLFPTLGSLVKGGFKVLFAYGRKGVLKAGASALDAGMWKAISPWVEAGIVKFNDFLARPEVRRALQALKIDNPYKYFAEQLRQVAKKLKVNLLTQAMDSAIQALKGLTAQVEKWGSASMGAQARELVKMIDGVRKKADGMLAKALRPVNDMLNQLARRLEVEADMNYRAVTNSINPHAFKRPTLDAEIDMLKATPPKWVDALAKPKYQALDAAPKIPVGFPDLAAKSGPLRRKYDTFHTIQPLEISPGTTLYRVLDPGSADNSICWMTKAEFDKLKSKDDWRRHFAVWSSWNRNGEFVTYTVPVGQPLKVWEGITGSQELRDAAGNAVSAGAGGKKFFLEGGARQIVLDPKDLDKAHMGKRQPTGWGYGEAGESVSMVGVPTLKNYWFEA